MRLAFLDLPDDRVDLIPKARQTAGVDVVFVAHDEADALALRIAEMLQVPRSTEPLDLLPLKPDLIALPSLDAPSAAMLLKAGFSPGIFVTLDELFARFEHPVQADATGDPTPIEEWEAHFDVATGSRLGQLRDALALSDDRQRLFREVLTLAIDQAGGDAGSIMLVDDDAGELRIAFADGLSSEVVRTMRQPLGEGIAGRVAQEGRPVVVHDRIDDPRFRDGRERSRITAAMCVPLNLEGRVIGVLNVSSAQPAKHFNEADLARLVTIGNQISGILERVVERTRRDLQAIELGSRQAMEDALATAAPDVGAGGGAARFRALARVLPGSLDAERVTLYLADPGGRQFTVVSSSVPSGPEGSLPVAAAGLAAAVLRDGEPIFLGDRLGRGAKPNVVLVPIGGRTRQGVLAAENVGVSGADTEPFTRLLARLGERLGQLVEAQRAEDSVARQSVVFGSLADVAPRLMMSRDVEFLCSEAAGALRHLKPAAFAAARLVGRDGATIERSAFDGAERERLDAAERESVLAAMVLSEGSERISIGGAEGEPAHAIVPIRLGERILGTLSLVAPVAAGASLDAIDVEALRKIGLYVSLAWEQTMHGRSDPRPLEDPVTGLLGSAGLEARVQDEVKRAERYHDRFLLTLCAFPDFEALESAHGTDWARSLLRQFAEALAHNVREVDTVARLGGGRFAVLSPETDKDRGALLRRLDNLVPRLECVRGLRNPDEVRFQGRQFTYPDEVPTGGEVLELLRSERAI